MIRIDLWKCEQNREIDSQEEFWDYLMQMAAGVQLDGLTGTEHIANSMCLKDKDGSKYNRSSKHVIGKVEVGNISKLSRDNESAECRDVCFEQESIVVTDSPKIFQFAVSAGVAVLPVPDTMEELDLFPSASYLVVGREHVDDVTVKHVYERFHHIPWTILETERVVVREQTVADVGALYEIYAAPGMTDYTDALYENPDEEKAYAAQYIHNMYEIHEHGIWIVEDRHQPGKIIGRAGLELRGGFDTPELGYMIRKEYQGQGYAYEACKAILEYGYAELGFTKVRCLTDVRNEASVKLCEKLGFSWDSVQMIEGCELQQYIWRIPE